MTNAERLRMLRLIAIANGMCSICRARPARFKRKTCKECVDRQRTRSEKNRSEGLCECGRRRKPGSTTCYRCPIARSIRNAKLRDKKRSAGICVEHGCYSDAAPHRVRCKPCLAKASIRSAAWARR